MKQSLEPRSVDLGTSEMVLGAVFDAYPKRQFVTEFTNINSLADHHMWSTIKTLPVKLPEPSNPSPRSRFQDLKFHAFMFYWSRTVNGIRSQITSHKKGLKTVGALYTVAIRIDIS